MKFFVMTTIKIQLYARSSGVSVTYCLDKQLLLKVESNLEPSDLGIFVKIQTFLFFCFADF